MQSPTPSELEMKELHGHTSSHNHSHGSKIAYSKVKFVVICLFEILHVSLILLLLVTYFVDVGLFAEKEDPTPFELSRNSTTEEVVEFLAEKYNKPICLFGGKDGTARLLTAEVVSIVVFSIYIITAFGRIAVFFGFTADLARKQIGKYLFQLDAIAALGLLKCMSYLGYVPTIAFPALSWFNFYPKLCPEADPLVSLIIIKQLLGWAAIGLFCVTIFVWNGLFRALTEKVIFTHGMVITYKLIRLYGAFLNMIVVVLVLKSNQFVESYRVEVKGNPFDYELFLLFVINTVVYLLEMFFHISKHVEKHE